MRVHERRPRVEKHASPTLLGEDWGALRLFKGFFSVGIFSHSKIVVLVAWQSQAATLCCHWSLTHPPLMRLLLQQHLQFMPNEYDTPA